MNGTHRIRYVNSPTSNLVVPLPCERWAYFMIMGNLELIKETMTSLQIAEVTGKEHKTVMRDIRSLEEQVSQIDGYRFVPTFYDDSVGRKQPMYELGKKECLLLASGYDTVLRAKIINRWEELETEKQSNLITMPNFTDPAEAAIAWAEQYRAKEAALLEAKSAQDNVKRLVHDRKTYTTSEIAKELGLKSANQLNKFLEDAGIQYKLNGTWLLYSNYSNLDYTSTKQIVLDNGHVAYDRRWTGLGRDFILTILDPAK